MKCFARKIQLKDIYTFQDKENKDYVDAQIANEIFENLPIGFSSSE